jgi:diadenosine tetraphosphate (Ap4A) HIT family hydrolase
VKLHDKMSALEKLAKIRKMYDDEKENKGNTAGETIKELHVHVKGSRSTLQVNGERFNVEVSDADMKVTP